MENDLTDLWAILDWTTPGLLGTLTEFRARWVGPVQTDRDPDAGRDLARLVGPFLLRRRKSDPGIAPELPAKTETDQPVALTAEQAALYQACVAELLDTIADTDGLARHGLVVKLLTALKQICNHPAHYLRRPRRGWPGAPASWTCSTNCSTRSSPAAAPCWSSPSTWRWPGCCTGT